MTKSLLYFAYGANSTLDMMAAITGKDSFVGQTAILENFDLFLQKEKNIPDNIIVDPILSETPRQKIQHHWQKGFVSYVAKPGNGKILGTLWEITEEERNLIRNWEMVGFWYKEIEIDVLLENGKNVHSITEVLGENQGIDQKADGLNYNPFPIEKQSILQAAKETREKYYNKLKLNTF